MRELGDRERELADQHRHLNRDLGQGTPPHGRSPHRRSPSGDRSPRRRRSRSRDRHNYRAPDGNTPPRRNTPSHDDRYDNNDGSINNKGHGGVRVNNGGGRENNNNGGYGGDDDDYHRRHDDFNGRNNDGYLRRNDDGRVYNNNQSNEAALLREQLEKLERKNARRGKQGILNRFTFENIRRREEALGTGSSKKRDKSSDKDRSPERKKSPDCFKRDRSKDKLYAERSANKRKNRNEMVFTVLNTSRSRILNEIKNRSDFERPQKLNLPSFRKNNNKYCDYHQEI
ncbi:hypothetical protein AgCh_001611 [Apium graveolens]